MRGGEKGKGVRLEEALGSDAGILSFFIYLFIFCLDFNPQISN
jgi:hypothetical protein